MDGVLAIKREGEPLDLHMVEIQEMQHKTDMDTRSVVRPGLQLGRSSCSMATASQSLQAILQLAQNQNKMSSPLFHSAESDLM